MNKNLKLVINNSIKNFEEKYFFEKNELKIILDLYAKMVSEGSINLTVITYPYCVLNVENLNKFKISLSHLLELILNNKVLDALVASVA